MSIQKRKIYDDERCVFLFNKASPFSIYLPTYLFFYAGPSIIYVREFTFFYFVALIFIQM